MYPDTSFAQPDQPAWPVQYGTTPRPQMPPQHTGWAAAALIFFWPLAFAAFNHSSAVYPLWANGDYAGAQHASDQAKRLGKISLWLCVAATALVIIVYFAFIAVLISSIGDVPTRPSYR